MSRRGKRSERLEFDALDKIDGESQLLLAERGSFSTAEMCDRVGGLSTSFIEDALSRLGFVRRAGSEEWAMPKRVADAPELAHAADNAVNAVIDAEYEKRRRKSGVP